MFLLVFTGFLTEDYGCRHSGQFLCAFPTQACPAVSTPQTWAVHSSKLRAFPLLEKFFLGNLFMGNLLPPFIKQFSIPFSSSLL